MPMLFNGMQSECFNISLLGLYKRHSLLAGAKHYHKREKL